LIAEILNIIKETSDTIEINIEIKAILKYKFSSDLTTIYIKYDAIALSPIGGNVGIRLKNIKNGIAAAITVITDIINLILLVLIMLLSFLL
jgi:hypothetical protein